MIIGPGAQKEAQLLGLGLPKLSFRQHDDLSRAKKYAMEQSIKHVLMKQTVNHQAQVRFNARFAALIGYGFSFLFFYLMQPSLFQQQKVAMYAQALSLMARLVFLCSLHFSPHMLSVI